MRRIGNTRMNSGDEKWRTKPIWHKKHPSDSSRETSIWISYSAVFDSVDSVQEARRLFGVDSFSNALP